MGSWDVYRIYAQNTKARDSFRAFKLTSFMNKRIWKLSEHHHLFNQYLVNGFQFINIDTT